MPRVIAGSDHSGTCSTSGLRDPLTRRRLLSRTTKIAGAAAFGDLANASVGRAAGQPPVEAPAVRTSQFTDWGWPLPYEQISAKSKQWLQSKGWWPLKGGWVVIWSGEEIVSSQFQAGKFLQSRGIESDWRGFVGAGYVNQAFIPGRLELATIGALGVLTLISSRVPTLAVATLSPALTHAAMVPLKSPLRSLADLKDAKVLRRPAVVGVTRGSTNDFAFIAAAHYLGLKPDHDYVVRSAPPGELAAGLPGFDVYTDWEPHVSYSTEILKVTRLLESLDPYYIYSGYFCMRRELHENVPDVVQALTDAYMEVILWSRVHQREAMGTVMRLPAYAHFDKGLLKKMSELYMFWPKPTVHYPFDDPNGIWPKEESRISKWTYETGASRNLVTDLDWQKVRQPIYMDATFRKLGWKVPERPPFLPANFGPIGQLPYAPYGARLLRGPVPFPAPGDLVRPWTFMGKTYRP
ncbi:MAG: ABC transporter substrate-binding protein [Terriglobia bacterium]